MHNTALRPIRFTREDAAKIKSLKSQLASLYMTQFIAGGDNRSLKVRCDELARQIRVIESKYEDAA
jgi:hypothetical protein